MPCLGLLSNFLFVVCITKAVIAETGYFWHITDFHYDFTYHDIQLSCNRANVPKNPGKYGDFWCDSPWSLVSSGVNAMARIQPNVDFVLWTGDTILHGTDKDLNYTINAVLLDNATGIIRNKLPDVPVYATFGNHDYWPNNQYPPSNNMLYDDTWNRWKDWINDPSQKYSFRKSGYYTTKSEHGLRIVALNTNLYYTHNKAILNEEDPAGQLQWLNTTLLRAKTNNDKVLITSHIPIGIHSPNSVLWMHEKYHIPLVEILRTYTEIIVAMHFGHDHSDGFKVLHDPTGQNPAPLFMAPSVTPWKYMYIIPNKIGPAHNPGIRLVEYDRTTGIHRDIKQYYLNLTKANEDGVADWELEYTFSTAYGTKSLTGDAIESVVNEMQQSRNGQKFNKFWKHSAVSPPDDLVESCTDNCRLSVVCGFTKYDMVSFESCKTNLVSGSSSMFIPMNSFIAVIMYVFIFQLC